MLTEILLVSFVVNKVNILQFRTLVAFKQMPRQTVQNQTRLLLQKQLVLVCTVCYSNKHFENSSPDNHHVVEVHTEKGEEILEHLPNILSLRIAL